jgi:peroxin-16
MPSWPRKGVSEVTSRLDPFSLTPTLPSVYALLSLVSSHHDTLISRRLSPKLSLPPHPFVTPPPPSADAPAQPPLSRTSPLLAPPSEHARYTRYWTERSGVYRKASRTLATLGYVELLVEMLARRRGDRVRWRLVLLIESVK